MTTISLFLKLRQNRRHTTEVEFDKEPFGENRVLISLFLEEIIQINENSRWMPGDNFFLITMNFI